MLKHGMLLVIAMLLGCNFDTSQTGDKALHSMRDDLRSLAEDLVSIDLIGEINGRRIERRLSSAESASLFRWLETGVFEPNQPKMAELFRVEVVRRSGRSETWDIYGITNDECAICIGGEYWRGLAVSRLIELIGSE